MLEFEVIVQQSCSNGRIWEDPLLQPTFIELQIFRRFQTIRELIVTDEVAGTSPRVRVSREQNATAGPAEELLKVSFDAKRFIKQHGGSARKPTANIGDRVEIHGGENRKAWFWLLRRCNDFSGHEER